MLHNTIFNNILVISWLSVLLDAETGVPGENHKQIVSHNIISSTPRCEHNVGGDKHRLHK